MICCCWRPINRLCGDRSHFASYAAVLNSTKSPPESLDDEQLDTCACPASLGVGLFVKRSVRALSSVSLSAPICVCKLLVLSELILTNL